MVTMGPYPKSQDEHKEVTNYTQKCHSNNTLMWNNRALWEDFSCDVYVIFLTLKETSTAKLTGSRWCSTWQTRLVTTLSGFPPVTMRSKSKHSFSSRPKPTKDKWINDEPINQLYERLFSIYNELIQVNLVEGGFFCIIWQCTVWHTYSTSRGLYFYYVAVAAHSLPLKKDAGFAVVPHLTDTRHRNTMNNWNCGTRRFDRNLSVTVNMRKKVA